MKDTIPEVDDYIAKAPEYARLILERIRKVAHKACPDLQEAIKWGHPHFMVEGLMAGFSVHKQHVNFGFWRGELLDAPKGVLNAIGKTAMKGMKLEKLGDLPTQKVLTDLFKQAADLNREPTSTAKPKKRVVKRPAPKAPADLMAALKKNKQALATYQAFSPSNKREYVQWITGAKREATREKRLAQAIEWMAAGKPRNWKYMNC